MVNRKMPPQAFAQAWGEQRRVWLVEAERFALDGGAMFGVVPRVAWQRRLAPDLQHRVPLAARCLVVQQGEAVLVVDCGLGDRWGEGERERLGMAAQPPGVEAGLRAVGLTPEQVTHLVLTHLHFDHSGGLLRAGPGPAAPVFPRAQIIVQQQAWEHAASAGPRDRASFRKADLEWLADSGALHLVRGRAEVLPGVELFPCQGHTSGMQLVRVQGPERWLLYAADLVPTQHHVRLAWHMGYDLQPLQTLAEKAHWLGAAADEHAWLALEHDPAVRAVRVRRRGDDFEVSERLQA